MAGVSYYRVVQPDAPSCARKDFRTCGDVVADQGLVRMLHQLVGRARPYCSIVSLRGWRCIRDSSDAIASDQARLSTRVVNWTANPSTL